MKTIRALRVFAVCTASIGMMLPQAGLAAGLSDEQPQTTGLPAGTSVVRDIALADGGLLQGQVVDTRGNLVQGKEVILQQDGRVIARPTTDTRGRFSVSGLHGGVYQIATSAGGGVYRVWSVNSAPPIANRSVTVIEQGPIVRGQCAYCGDIDGGCAYCAGQPGVGFGGRVLSVLSNPWVIGGIVATAIAVPLALDDDDDAS